MTQNNDLLQQLSGLSSEAKRALLNRLMQTQAEQVERWEAVSYNQQALWFHANMAPESYAYNLLYAVRIFEAVDSSALRVACQQVVQRYPILTATFAVQDEKIALHIVPRLVIPIEEIDTTSWNSEKLQLELETRGNQTIDLAQGPLFRILLLRRGANETILACISHHIILDFWAFNILADELFTLYGAAKTQATVTLPPPVAQHSDYIQWQQTMLASSLGEQHWDYWRETLAAPLPVLSLPTDHPRPPVQSYPGATFNLTLSQTLTKQLRRLANQEKVTPFTLLLAGYQTLIFRYTNQDDILIGTPALGRDEALLERLIDDVTNPVIIRTHITPGLSFVQLLRESQQQVLQALKHQDYPFPLLVERLQLARDLSYPPLYQTAFIWDKPRRRSGSTRLAFEPFLYGQQGALFDLALTIFEFDDKLITSFRYNTDLFESATIERLANHFLVLLEHIVTQVEQPIQTIPLLTQQEQQQIVMDCNNPARIFSPDLSIYQLIEKQALQQPDAIAIRFDDSEISYQQLNMQANYLAAQLQRHHVGPDTLVGVYMERSIDLVITLLAIFKAGGAYVPLDPAYPVARLEYMLSDAQTTLVITQEQLYTRLQTTHTSAEIIAFKASASTILEHGPVVHVDPTHLAYMIYTSGSTGTPKGVMVPHANVMRLLSETQDWFHFTSQDTWTFFHSYAFDFSVWEIWGALLTGGRLLIVPYDVSREPSLFYQLLCQEAVTVLNQTPSAFQQLIQAEARETLSTPLALRLVIFGGEALELKHLAPWIERHGEHHPQLINMYGITETTVHVTYRAITQQDFVAQPRSVIGRAIPDLSCYVLDEQLQLLPRGIPGELYVGGPGLARGYWQQPTITAERFIPDPFSRLPGERLYRTGDRVRLLAIGELEYLGRNDQQVKLRGFRIELGEIEAILREHEEIKEAVVLLHEHHDMGSTLVAYIVPSTTITVSIEELRGYLGRFLPAYMVPSSIMTLSAFPLTANGKIDRLAFPHPDRQQRTTETAFVLPQTALQEQLAEIWSQLLQLSQVSIYDNFFNLGGHSLLITRLATRIQSTFEVKLSLRELFEAPTIEQMASLIEQRQLELIAQAEQIDNEELMQMLATLDGLSDDALHLLAEQSE